ncbi:lipopolysaccharide biosynthesis protein [Thiovibrio sp. JS02]
MLLKLISYLPATIIPAVAGFLMVPLVTRALSPREMGIYSLALGIIGLSVGFAGSWLTTSILRFHLKYSKFHSYGGTLCRQTALMSILVVSVCLASTPFFISGTDVEGLASLAFLIAVVAGMRLLIQTVLQIYRSAEQPLAYTILHVWRTVMPFLLLYFLKDITPLTSHGIFAIFLICQLLAMLYLLFRYRINFYAYLQSGYDWPMVRQFLKYGFPLSIIQISALIIDIASRFILKYYAGLGAAGIFFVGYSICRAPVALFTELLATSLGPVNVKIWSEEGKDAALIFYAKQMHFVTVIILPLIAAMTFYGSSWLVDLTTVQYASGAALIPWLMVGFLFNCYQWILQRPLSMLLRSRLVMIIYLLGMIFYIGIAWVLTKNYGIAGCAWATFFSNAFIFCFVDMACRRLGVMVPYMTWRFVVAWVVVGLLLFVMPRGECLTHWFIEGPVMYLLFLVLVGLVLYPRSELVTLPRMLEGLIRS